jgi:4a-hydroxytetrahydrobiopterin dehydratase
MDPRVSFITLAVPDLDGRARLLRRRARLGGRSRGRGDVLMIEVGDKLVLSLWAEAGFEGEVGPIRRGDGHVPITLSHNVPTREEVDAALELARAAGRRTSATPRSASGAATPATSPTQAGFRWEVATNPGPSDRRAAVTTRCTADPIQQERLADWVLVVRALEARYETHGFATGLELVARIGAAAEEADHHPDVTLTWPTVLVRLWSHDAQASPSATSPWPDASATSPRARRRRDAARTQNLELCPRHRRHQGDGPVLGRGARLRLGRGAPRDRRPRRPDADARGSSRPTAHDDPAQRWHLDIHVDPAVADQRIDAALAAAAYLVSDEQAPSFTILADAEGNRVCVCTWQSAAEEIA